MDVPDGRLSLFHDGVRLADMNKSLQEHRVQNNDMLVISTKNAGTSPHAAAAAQSPPSQPMNSQALEALRQQILGNPTLVAQLETNQPELLNAARANSPAFPILLQQLQEQLLSMESEKTTAYVHRTNFPRLPLDLCV